MDEAELSQKIATYLNLIMGGYKFSFINSFCDVADEKNGIYIEVKQDHFALAQLLHAIVKKHIEDAEKFGVADSKEVRFYKPVQFSQIEAFVRRFDVNLTFSSSDADRTELNEQAELLLGEPEYTIILDFKPSKFFYITKENMGKVREYTDKYRIHLDLLVNWLDGVGEQDVITVNPDGWLVNTSIPDKFLNEQPHDMRNKQLEEFKTARRPKHIAIKETDKSFFESLRVKHEDLQDVLHEVDRLITRKKRREKGVFWTESDIADSLAPEIIQLTQPEHVVEPCVGGGSLISKIVPLVKGAMNDIDVAHINNCKKIYDGYNWKFTTLDVVSTPTDELMKAWEIPKDKILLLYTNPPFGTSSTNKLASTFKEMDERPSRQQKIAYPSVLLKYGKGDLFIPIVGRLIEIAKAQQKCYIAFFSPFGLFCGRRRYNKLYSALLKDFKLVKGYVFTGENFHDINKTLSIALSIWEYSPNFHTLPQDVTLTFIDRSGETKQLRFKQMALLKDGWRYRDGSKYVKRREGDAISVARCDRFNTPQPKVFGVNMEEGSGAEVSPDNLKLDRVVLNIPNVPSELVYALWSVSVGRRTFESSMSVLLHPAYFDSAYVHLPDFTRKESIEILAYSALGALLKNYAEDRIGFFGTNRVFRFGNERLTKGVEHLIKTCKDAPTYDNFSIADVFQLLRDGTADATKLRKSIKNEVAKRLEAIGYWDYIPIPTSDDNSEKFSED